MYASGSAARYDFQTFVVTPQSDELFDPSQYGCPAEPPPAAFYFRGNVFDALTLLPIPNARVSMITGTTPFATSCGSLGDFEFVALPVSSAYTLSFASDLYNPLTLTNFNVSQNLDGRKFFLMPYNTNNSLFEIMLTWGPIPPDLDLLIRTPWGCTCYYASRRCANTDGSEVRLDSDVRYGYGPETSHVYEVTDLQADYVLYVRGGYGQWNQSGASVHIYRGHSEVGTGVSARTATDTSTPPGTALYWNVGRLRPHSTTAVFTAVNQLVSSMPSINGKASLEPNFPKKIAPKRA